MDHLVTTLTQLFIIIVSAKLVGELFERFHQPAVVGELLIGMVIGQHALGWLHESEIITILAELAVIFLLFQVGLETKLSDMMKVGKKSFWVALLGVILPFVAGFAYMAALHQDYKIALFLAAAMVATSVGITARVLADLKFLQSKESRIVLGAAVIDDVLGMIVLAMVSGLSQGDFSAVGLVKITIQAVMFVVLVIGLGTLLTSKFGHLMAKLKSRNMPIKIAIVSCLGLAALAQSLGLAAIIGAFLAGMVFAETNEQFKLEHKLQPMNDFLVPVFFVVMGASVDVRLFLSVPVITMALIVTALAVVTKLFGCGLAVLKQGVNTSLIIGIGMVPRGEVGLIIAAIGSKMKVIPDDIYAVIVFMCMATTLLMPPFMKMAVKAKMKLDQGKN